MDTIFFKLYSKEINCEEIFGVHKQKDIFKFIKEVVKNKKKNCFAIDKSFIRKHEFFEKLNAKRKENKLTDCAITTVYE